MLPALLTVFRRVFVCVVFRTLTRRIAGVAPLVCRIKARTGVTAAVRTTLDLKIEDIGMSFWTVAVMTGDAAVVIVIVVINIGTATAPFLRSVSRYRFGSSSCSALRN